MWKYFPLSDSADSSAATSKDESNNGWEQIDGKWVQKGSKTQTS